METAGEIYRALDEMGIVCRAQSHPLAETMEDLRDVEKALGAVIPKNLFLTPRNRSTFYLCLVMPQTVFHTSDISKQIGCSRLSFAGPEDMARLLHTHPGAVSPLGLLFESAKEVRLVVDRALAGQTFLGFHPNDNTQTLAMRASDFFEVFIPQTGRAVTWVTAH